MGKTLLLIILIFPFFLVAKGQPVDTSLERKKYFTKHLTGSITLDGIPQEEAWNLVEWGTGFTQWKPEDGKPSTQQTKFKILYDDKFLYVAYRCEDLAPDSIVKRMARRDEFPGDFIEIHIDSYHDQRTAFSFTISVSGVRGDEFISNDGNNWDANWNPIWFSKTHIDDQGWTAEIKIPFSQLRYSNDDEKVWGFQVVRHFFRRDEFDMWQNIPQSTGVWVSRFAELHGLKNIAMHKQIEIAPYTVVQADTYKKEAGNPFAKGFDKRVAAGVDGKLALTNDLILDFTINPDFGQVEADPSQVRIDGFQNFFEEKRPFFIESRNIFDYQLTGSTAGGEYDEDLLFYSRRIGNSPHLYPESSNGEYLKVPQNTSILGASKFSGKTRKGWSIGVLESVTERELATIDNAGQKSKEVVEPLTNYFVGRLQKDIKKGNTVLGGIITGVNRENGLEDLLHRGAYSGGFDFLHFWSNRKWYIRGNIVASRVEGTRSAILNTQTSFEHLFQRPGANEISIDSNRTFLTGIGGTFLFGKNAGRPGRLGQVFKFETGITFRSPQLELNDIGFMLTSNEINQFTWVGLHYQKQFSVFRNARLNYNQWFRWDFSGKFIYQQHNVNANGVFRNNWEVGTSITWNPFDISNNALRGASSIRRPSFIGHTFNVTSDTRKNVYAKLNVFNGWGFPNALQINEYGVSLTFQPLDALRIMLSANYSYYTRRQDQFVGNVNFYNTIRTIVSEVKQKTLRFTGRLSYNISPDLTIQYYGQPYITRPLYSNFAYVSHPLAKRYDDRFYIFNPSQISLGNNEYIIDEDGNGTPDYSFSKPDFNFVQFRSNLIVRWEYRAGSELYLVWSQSNTINDLPDPDLSLAKSLFDQAFTDQTRNIFLVKWTYRFLR